MATQWLQNDRLVSHHPTKNPWKIRGLRHGPSGTRTPDPLIKSWLRLCLLGACASNYAEEFVQKCLARLLFLVVFLPLWLHKWLHETELGFVYKRRLVPGAKSVALAVLRTPPFGLVVDA
jgi:hypothetical protein